MDRGVALVLTLLVGALLAFQPPVNALLAKHVGDVGAAFTALLVSTAMVGVVLVLAGDVGELRGLRDYRPVYLVGALAGAAVVLVSLVAVRSLGAGGVTAALVSTQLIVSAVIDRLGIVGVDQAPLDLPRITGIALLIAGTVLVVR
jgi:bacterial/archaeal transporter family-2 protein